MNWFRDVARLACVTLAWTAAVLAHAADSKPLDFQHDIAPIFRQHCLSCHQSSKKSGDLSLTTSAGLRDSGYVVAGKPDESQLLKVISPDGPGKRSRMPKEGEPLTDEQVRLLRQWISAGAKWPQGFEVNAQEKADKLWWSLQPLGKFQPPKLEDPIEAWAINTIDRFVYSKLSERGLRPSPPADRRTLIRRVTYDLTGLPPAPEEINEFLRDDSADAYERLVDRLLASPRYGERWGRHWLDVIRFGESNGYEQNHLRDDAWLFRDYVIRSLNADKPFDRFVLEQLAGDVIGGGDPDVVVGTGFLVAGSFDSVGNDDPVARQIIRANTLDDIISATGSAFLGLTINCSRCHDHKFDPITQLDYYRMQAAFAGVHQGSSVLASDRQKREHALRRAPLEKQLADVRAGMSRLRQSGDQRLKKRRESLVKSLFPRRPVDKNVTEETFDPFEAKFVRLTVKRTTGGNGRRSVSLDEVEVFTADVKPRNVALASKGGKATVRSKRYSNDDPDVYGAHNLNDGEFDTLWISADPGGQLTIEFASVERITRVVWSVDRLRVYSLSNSPPFSAEYDIEVSLDGETWSKVASHVGRRPLDDKRINELLFLAVLTPEERRQHDELISRNQILEEALTAIGRLPTAWIGNFEEPTAVTYLMKGGDPTKRDDDVAPASLSVLDRVTTGYELKIDAPEAERREALARWITHRKNPLTPRVFINRIWQYHFGRGIVATPSDFGYNGTRPTHPELLDWLALQVHLHDWRWKPLHRLILTSQTYQQSSRFDEQSAAIDADTAWLWRFPPQRLTAEAIRDSILAVAGKLDQQIGGPSFRLYEYTVDNVATYYPLDEVGPNTYRRAVYHQNPRAVKVDVLSEYDLPECSLPAPRRVVTTSPLQALTLQNHSFIIDLAHFFAERLRKRVSESDIAGQIRQAYVLVFGREPESVEVDAAAKLIREHGLMVFCRALLNSNEMIYVN